MAWIIILGCIVLVGIIWYAAARTSHRTLENVEIEPPRVRFRDKISKNLNRGRTKIKAKVNGVERTCYREQRTDGTYAYYDDGGCLIDAAMDAIILMEVLDAISTPAIPDSCCGGFSDPSTGAPIEASCSGYDDSGSGSYESSSSSWDSGSSYDSGGDSGSSFD